MQLSRSRGSPARRGAPCTPARRLIALLVAASTPVVACERAPDPPDIPLREPIASPSAFASLTVGFVGTLSGPHAWRGEDAFEGADLAVHHLNRARPRGSPPFELVQLDDRGDPGEAADLVESLARLRSTVGIVYAGPPEGLAQAEPALARAGVPAVLCFGDLGASGAASRHLFQAGPSVAVQARRLASYLVGDRGYVRVGVLAASSREGGGVVAALRAALRARGAALVAGRYASARLDLRPHLRRLRRRRAEAVIVQGGPAAVSGALAGLRRLGAVYRTTAGARLASARPAVRRRRSARGWWHPQVAALDLAVGPRVEGAPPGTVAPETLGRGAHYLPVASLRRFRRAFRMWWGAPPLGWELRAYDAARALGWAALRARPTEDLARALEALQGRRFGGLPVAFGPRDHDAPRASDVGLWVVPSPRAPVSERHRRPLGRLGWVPLARSFSHAGARTDVARRDWPALFGASPSGPPPRFNEMRFGVTTGRSDPVH